ncbi:hypothetical protein BDW59DRAFT_70177 [Aspergillus cavernicola]|uniref:Hydroxyneurosporene synthase n=1 Tax=Aspergillus cavernicola TaxID=176166 RepID=A0ABR4IFX8_9EURO
MAPKLMNLLPATLALLAGQALSQKIIIPPFAYPGESDIQWISGPDGFDSPKNNHITDTAYDWWYFDVVEEPYSGNGDQPSFAATFHTTGSNGFDPLRNAFPMGFPSTTFVQIDLAWPNGTTDSWVLFAGGASFTVDGDGASANFSHTGASFEGAPDLSSYVVNINAPEKGVVGSLRIDSATPAHYTCGPNEEGQTIQLTPGAGWVNAIPDGYAEVDFELRGEKFKFQGRGYHDHNFGNRPFSEALAASYWGHGRLGDYTIVWVDALAQSGDNHLAAYVSKEGELITASCQPGSILVRPYGDNSTYPPTQSTGAPTGFSIEITIPEGQLELKAEYIHITVDSDLYRRFTGTLTGTLDGESLPDGIALWEQFTLQE